MPTTPNMNLVLPTEDSDSDVWDALLNAALGADGVDGHDHTTGKGVKVPSAGLNINADVAWASGGSPYSITGLKAIDFEPVAASGITGYASALFVSSADNNLYFRNQSGTNVKITDGTTLNVSIVGGIGGDYSSVSALLDYDDATDTYRFRQETSASVRQYAKVATADLLLREYKAAGDATVPTNAVTIKSPAALAAAYTLTLPAAVPVAAAWMQMTDAGVVTASNALNQEITVSDMFHTGVHTRWLPHVSYQGGNGTTRTGYQIEYWTLATNADAVHVPAPVEGGERIVGYRIFVVKTTDATDTVTARLWRLNADGTKTQIGTDATNSTAAPGATSITVTGLAEDIDNTINTYLITVQRSTNDSGNSVLLNGAYVDVTRPGS